MDGSVTKEYVQSLGKTLAILLVCLAFVAIAIFAPDDHSQSKSWRFWCGSFFGLCGFVGVWTLARPRKLTLDSEGFTLSGGFLRSPKKTLWDVVEGFFVYRLPRGGKMIGFNYIPGRGPSTALVKLNGRLGAEGALPKLWPGPPEALAEELNSYRGRFSKG